MALPQTECTPFKENKTHTELSDGSTVTRSKLDSLSTQHTMKANTKRKEHYRKDAPGSAAFSDTICDITEGRHIHMAPAPWVTLDTQYTDEDKVK